MAVTGTPYSGVEGRVVFNTVPLRLSEWSVEVDASSLPTTVASGNGYAEQVRHIHRATVTARGFWDGSQNPHADPPNIFGCTYAVECQLYVSVPDDLYWFFTALYIEKVNVTCDVEGVTHVEFTGKSEFKFWYPGEL